MASLFVPPKKPPKPSTPQPDKSQVQKAAADQRRRLALQQGRSSTLVATRGERGLGFVG